MKRVGPSGAGAGWATARPEVVAPTLAATTHARASHWAAVSVSPRTSSAAIAAAAGSRLISTPNVRAGSTRRALISSE